MEKEQIQSIDNRCKWRGKRINDMKWIYGSLIDCGSEYHIIEKGENLAYFGINRWNLVCYPTVGQYTGYNDKYNEEIYEGDIVENERYNLKMTVVYQNHEFVLTNDAGMIFDINCFITDEINELEVVGNIYDKKQK